jgi:peptide-methionine (S)-S-oxide reductase
VPAACCSAAAPINESGHLQMENIMATNNNGKQHEMITLGGGCFWCLEAVYDEMIGVESVVSGYAGGHVDNPSYKQVVAGRTGHAEVVQISFDPAVVTARDLLEVFFVIHDPTTLNRQGADVGTQYRSGIFFHSPAQKETAEEIIAELTANKAFADPIVTAVAPVGAFYPAEAYHQDYYRNNKYQPYCMVVISPKLKKFRQKFGELRRA